jgi:hypothetical protein
MDFEYQSHVWTDFYIPSTTRYQPELGSFNHGGPVGCVWLHTEGINQPRVAPLGKGRAHDTHDSVGLL